MAEERSVKKIHKPLPMERRAITKRFTIYADPEAGGSVTGFVTVGLYPDGRPGEVFITMAKEGTALRHLLDAVGIAVSVGLQNGVPIDTFVQKFSYTRSEPSGMTDDPPPLKFASSILDYVFRWIGLKFCEQESGFEEKETKFPTELPNN